MAAMGVNAYPPSCYAMTSCRSGFLQSSTRDCERWSICNSNRGRRWRSKGGGGGVFVSAFSSDVVDVAVQRMSEQNPSFVTWQVIAGAAAGVTPFVVAGIEFSKRIASQKRCQVCKGSGLVKRDEYYFRCYQCGGFLPWQSWQRFFTGK